MKKRNLNTLNLSALALLGIGMTLCTSGCDKAKADEMSGEMKTFYEQLTPDAQRKFRELDESHKKASMKILELGCKADSACKGHRERAVDEQYRNQMQERSQKNGELQNKK